LYFFIVRYYALFIRVERAIYSLLKRDLVHVIRNVFGFLYDDKLSGSFSQKIESANPAQPS
jgi:hypothetical protein